MDGSSAVYRGQNVIEELDQDADLIERIRQGDLQAIAAFAKEYRELVIAITDDIFEDRERSSCAAKATFQQAVYQIRSGVKMGQIEPWLMWIARNEALSLTQFRKNTQTAEPRAQALETKPAMLPFQAQAEQDADNEESGAPLREEKQPASPDGIEGLMAVQRSGGENDRYERARSFEERASADAADAMNRATADWREEASSEDSAIAPDATKSQQRSKEWGAHTIGITIALAGVILLLLWMAIGLSTSNGLLRFPDLGYEWFNEKLFPLF